MMEAVSIGQDDDSDRNTFLYEAAYHSTASEGLVIAVGGEYQYSLILCG